jgi:hypothetical protein
MHLRNVLHITEARLFASDSIEESVEKILNSEVQAGFASDMMSDVLCYDLAQGLLITGLTNPQVVRTAEMADVMAILMVRGKNPLPETIKLAQKVGIPLFGNQMTMFETCGRLYAAGLRPLPDPSA